MVLSEGVLAILWLIVIIGVIINFFCPPCREDFLKSSPIFFVGIFLIFVPLIFIIYHYLVKYVFTC